MSASGLMSIDSNDWYDVYGWVVAPNGYDDFLRFWDRKTPMQHDWADANGIDVDLTTPVFKAKEINMPGAIVAKTEAEFWTRYRAMFNLLAQPGTRRIYVAEFSRSFYVYYDSCTAFGRLTRIKGNQVACKYTLKFIEPVPSLFNPFSYLVDKNGNKLITKLSNKIIIPLNDGI